MIWLLTGVPGSGKSYFAVSMIHDLINKEKDKCKISYEEASENIKVLHNIDGLKIGTVLEKYCAGNDINPIEIFTNNFHNKNEEFRGWTFVLDECQTLFPKNLRNEDVQRFFQLHRHYGIDVVLLSQDYKLVCPAISLLSEYQFRAVSDTANPLPGFFMYRQMVGWEQIGRKFKRKKQKVFDLYKTADFDQKKVKKKARPMLIIFIFCAILGLIGIYKISRYANTGLQGSSSKPIHTFSEKKQVARNRFQQDQFSGSFENVYPQSYLDKLNQKSLLTLDTIEDQTGTYYLLMGTLWPVQDFPYKTVKTRLGIQALVPLDLKQYEETQKEQFNQNENISQNSETYQKKQTTNW